VLNAILSLPKNSRIQILSPIVRDRKGNYRKELQEMRSEGFVRARIDNLMVDLTQDIILEKKKRHTIEIVIDRLIIKDGIKRQASEAIETSFKYSDTLVVNIVDRQKDIIFSKTAACLTCGISYPDINPRFFSFNSAGGACPVCNGLGFEGIEEESTEISGQQYCRACHGLRLRKEALSVLFQGKNIGEFSRMSAQNAASFLEHIVLTDREKLIAALRILKEVKKDRLSSYCMLVWGI